MSLGLAMSSQHWPMLRPKCIIYFSWHAPK